MALKLKVTAELVVDPLERQGNKEGLEWKHS